MSYDIIDPLENNFPFPCTGIVTSNDQIELGWPQLEEYDQITDLRNSPLISDWFLSNEPIDRTSNRIWIAEKMNRPSEGLLTIRSKIDGLFLGTFGWVDWDLKSNSATFGRLMIHRENANKFNACISLEVASVALEALMIARDWAFVNMNLETARTWYIEGNHRAQRVNEALGMVACGHSTKYRENGTEVKVVHLKMSRARWRFLSGQNNG